MQLPTQTQTPSSNEVEEFQLTELEREMARNSLAFYHNKVLDLSLNWHITDWYDVLENPINKKIVMLAPRNHAKSTIVSVNFSTWVIGNNPNIRIIIVSHSSTQSEAFLRSIKSIIENEEKYKEVFGSLKPQSPDKWSERDIIVDRSNTKEKDPTVSTVGAGGAILSKRADIIICDDILNEENTRTPEQREKVKKWFQDTLMPVLDPHHGIIVWISTAWNLEDLSHDLFKDPTYDVKRKYRAIIREATNQTMWEQYKDLLYAEGKESANKFFEENKEAMLEGSKVMWEDRFDYKTLYDMRVSLGTRSFNLMYQNEAVSDETAVIREAWVEQCKDPTRSLIQSYNPASFDVSISVIAQGVDLAISESDLANETVIMTLGLTADNKIMLMNGLGGRWSPGLIRSNIKGQSDRFNPFKILVENNAFQASMVKDLQELSTASIKGFTTTDEKFDEFVGINSIAVALENKQIILPANPRDPHTMTIYEKLKHDMISFPSGHTGDYLMAFWFAFTALRSVSGSGVFRITATNVKKEVET